jgi:hypothetical protein
VPRPRHARGEHRKWTALSLDILDRGRCVCNAAKPASQRILCLPSASGSGRRLGSAPRKLFPEASARVAKVGRAS